MAGQCGRVVKLSSHVDGGACRSLSGVLTFRAREALGFTLSSATARAQACDPALHRDIGGRARDDLALSMLLPAEPSGPISPLVDKTTDRG